VQTSPPQHSALFEQLPDSATQMPITAQWPLLSQTPVQHSAPLVQLLATGLQSTQTLPSQ